MTELVEFKSLDISQKEMVLSWRNDESVRMWMYNQDVITWDKHLSFIEGLKEDTSKRYFLVREDERDIGVIDLCQITKESAHGGLYQNPALKGFGRVLLGEMIAFSFVKLGVEKLYLEAFEENKRALKLYEKMGFIEVKSAIFNTKKLISLELKNENS